MTDKAKIDYRQAERTLAWSKLGVLLMLITMLILLGRVAQLKIYPDARLTSAIIPRMSDRNELAKRGDLIDSRNRVLATSAVAYRLFVDPTQVKDLDTIAVDIADAIGANPAEIDRTILDRPGRKYVVIDHELEDWQVKAISNATLRGVGLEPHLIRHYPQGENAANVVGMVGFEHTGLGGMEHLFDNELEPTDGKLTYLRDARRRALWIEPDAHTPATDGQDIKLSIDVVIQQIAQQRLAQVVNEYNAGGARAIVLNCKTGEILAMYDVLNAREGWDEVTQDLSRQLHPALGRNRCVSDPYEPGSTFKPFIWAVATELGIAAPNEIIPTPSNPAYRTTQGRRIRDSHYYGPVSWRRVLIHSINSGMAIVAERMTDKQMQQAVSSFGFGSKTDCGLPGESSGIVTSKEKWGHYTQTSVAMGHEIAVTPLQMVRAFSVIAGDGTLPNIRITANTPEDESYPVQHKIIEPSTAELVRQVLRDVMLEGTGKRAQSDTYEIFAKSGTAQLPKPDGSGYFEDRYVSSFIGAAPFKNPQIVVLCVVDDPDKSLGHYGGAIAGPVVRDIIDETLEYLGVEPDMGTVPDQILASDDGSRYLDN